MLPVALLAHRFFVCRHVRYYQPQEAEEPWKIRRLMRHLMEVILVAEGKDKWAKEVADGRRVLSLPLPSVDVFDDGNGLLRLVLEKLPRQLTRLVVSFI